MDRAEATSSGSCSFLLRSADTERSSPPPAASECASESPVLLRLDMALLTRCRMVERTARPGG